MKKIFLVVILVALSVIIYIFRLSSTPLPVYSKENTDKAPLVVKKEEPVTAKPLLFVGDIMLGRYVETLQKKGLDPFGSTIEILLSHTTIANLEGPIPEVHVPTPINGFRFSFPSTTPKYLKDHGIAVVSLANNHSLDQGRDGYEHTKLVLDEESISHFGAYDPSTSDYVTTQVGTTIVIVFGINMISSMWNEQAVMKRVSSLRAQFPGAYLISFIHWGNEYSHKQNETQVTFAHTLVDAGIDAIIGAHPHVVEGVEVYKGAPIFYSLGNFIFDQYFSKETQQGVMVSLDTKDGIFLYTLIPTASVRSKVSVADKAVSEEILDIISKNSDSAIRSSVKQGIVAVPVRR